MCVCMLIVFININIISMTSTRTQDFQRIRHFCIAYIPYNWTYFFFLALEIFYSKLQHIFLFHSIKSEYEYHRKACDDLTDAYTVKTIRTRIIENANVIWASSIRYPYHSNRINPKKLYAICHHATHFLQAWRKIQHGMCIFAMSMLHTSSKFYEFTIHKQTSHRSNYQMFAPIPSMCWIFTRRIFVFRLAISCKLWYSEFTNKTYCDIKL